MSDIINAYKKMLESYRLVFSDDQETAFYCPIKKTITLNRKGKIAVTQKTIMPSKTLSGWEGKKEIYVDDLKNEYHEDIFMQKKSRMVSYHDIGLTPFRCGIMTCVAISIIEEQGVKLNFDKVGFIGCGRTNISNCKAINDVFGINTSVIRGSHKCVGKNADKFVDAVVDDTENLELLNQCDVVVVCTSNFEKEHMISNNLLNKPKLFIILDCGYTLDESFRANCDSISDYSKQLCSEYQDEFPFDENRYAIKQLCKDRIDNEKQVCVYMHGIAFADLTIAEMKAEGEIK